ncbi:hypothetical protein Hesp01_46370 [Herbidospora sp. NBRC 101105]|nr:hypothetical protein Hesp01_46370 [Herbidospora sp. NBRC 101105]
MAFGVGAGAPQQIGAEEQQHDTQGDAELTDGPQDRPHRATVGAGVPEIPDVDLLFAGARWKGESPFGDVGVYS